MVATGYIRKVDQQGRFALPAKLRRTMDININDPLEMFVDDSNIILEKYIPECVFCGEATDVTEFKGAFVCFRCLEELYNN